MGGFSIWHILILAVLVLLLFGGNRFSAMMGDVAKGLKSFKQGLGDDDKNPDRTDRAERPVEPRVLPREQERPIDVTPEPRRDPVPPADDRSNG